MPVIGIAGNAVVVGAHARCASGDKGLGFSNSSHGLIPVASTEATVVGAQA